MHTAYVFLPARRLGILFHFALILLLAGAGLLGLLQASLAETGASFLFFLLPSLLIFSLIPYLLYRVYALWTASYILERDGLRLRWGLRYEQIPMDKIDWVQPASVLDGPLPLPRLSWPGNIAGARCYPDGTILEFMASQKDTLVVISTPRHMFVISPREAKKFIQTYSQLVELGSLTPLPARSVFPATLLTRSWSDVPARTLMIGSLALSLALLALVSLIVPQRVEIPLRLNSMGAAVEYQPAIQLMLLPVVNAFFVLSDLLLGMFFYRRSDEKLLAYLLWGTGFLSPLLFLSAVFFILRAS